jgi:peptidoglycan/LPS O-acetylase OafA/YrhL
VKVAEGSLTTYRGRVDIDRFLPSGSESGTAPGDRSFRPDVEGLRAVSVVLVVLFHAGLTAVSGGYIGVDVFFVISGFVITGLLLRERAASGRTSILAFYGRRARRIIPAATLVIIATVFLAYAYVDVGAGGRAVVDGRWAAVFLANFHFASIGTNYLAAQQPPSPLQNFWSLSVEEQFYVVYPTLFLLLAGARILSLRARLAIGLVVVIGASLTFSILETSSNPTGAYFSPFTRAWELGLGALVAVGTPWLLKVPARMAAAATWFGLSAILLAAFVFDAQTAYPGSLVTIPVVGAALIIAGGVRVPRLGVEALLGLWPMRWLGKHSYSLYLWHWPILVLAAEHAGKTSLSVRRNLAWVLVAVVASMVTYRFVENPIRHARWRARWSSIGLGVGLTAITLTAVTVEQAVRPAPAPALASTGDASPTGKGQPASLQTVRSLVAAADKIRRVPVGLAPPLSLAVTEPLSNLGIPALSTGCSPGVPQSTVPACVFGDRRGTHTMLLYGDSHAAMWFAALDDIATSAHWKLVVLSKGACPAGLLPTHAPGTSGQWAPCDDWHAFAVAQIKRVRPDLLIVSQELTQSPTLVNYSPTQWGNGLEDLFRKVAGPHTAEVVIGNIPQTLGPDCLTQSLSDVPSCSAKPVSKYTPFNQAELTAAVASGGRYIDVTPWFCAKTCSAVIGKFDVYFNSSHVAIGYTRFLEGVLAQQLSLSGLTQGTP